MSFGLYSGDKDESGFALSAQRLYYYKVVDAADIENNNLQEIFAQLTYASYIPAARIYWGLAIKYIYYDISIQNETSQGGSLDTGLSYRFYTSPKNTTIIDLGIALQNIIVVPATINISIDDDEITKIPFILRWGVGVKSLIFPRYNKKTDDLSYDEVRISADTGINDNKKFSSIGFQYTFINTFIFRTGYSSDYYFVYGGGIKFNDNFTINYAYQKSDISGIHKAEVLYRWGKTYNEEYNSDDKLLTDDFQTVYRMALRLYDRYLRDAVTLIEANKLSAAIELLNKIIPLNPQDNQALTVLQAADNQFQAQKTDNLLSQAHKNILEGKIERAFEVALKAFDVSPRVVIELINELYNVNNETIKKLKTNKIEELEEAYNKSLANADFDGALNIRTKLYLLQLTRDRKYDKVFVQSKIVTVEQYLVKAGETNNVQEKYAYIMSAQTLMPDDKSIQQQMNVLIKDYIISKPRSNKESELYNEKLYYIAAITLANNKRNTKKAYEELLQYNLLYKYNRLLEKYLIKNNIIEKVKP
jgi:hypothetical protein